MLCVSFVQTVDFSPFLDLHISVHQDELADRLQRNVRISGDRGAFEYTGDTGDTLISSYRVQHEAVDPLAGGQHHHGGTSIQSVTSGNNVPPRLQSILLTWLAICRLWSRYIH